MVIISGVPIFRIFTVNANMRSNDADEMSKSVEPHQRSSSVWVSSVRKNLSVQIVRFLH